MSSTYVAVFALVLAYLALVVAYLALRTLAKLRRASAVLGRGLRGEQMRESLVEATNRQAELTAVTREELAALRAQVDADRDAHAADADPSRTGPSGALCNVALVRYDAFDQMSGRMSFSLALLDEAGDGITISALAGPADTRVYAKGVTGGKAPGASAANGEGGLTQALSPEERQAITAALARTAPSSGDVRSRVAS